MSERILSILEILSKPAFENRCIEREAEHSLPLLFADDDPFGIRWFSAESYARREMIHRALPRYRNQGSLVACNSAEVIDAERNSSIA